MALNKTTLAKNIAFSLLPVVLLISASEVFFRLSPVYKDKKRTNAGYVIPDKELGWRLEVNTTGSYATNSMGFRDTEYNKNADKKILILGDSVSWGDGIKDVRKTYPYLLEQEISNRTGETYEVINSSAPGYSTFQQYQLLKLYGLDFEPDLIILQFCLNDVVERYTSLSQYGGNNHFLGVDTRDMIPGVHGWLYKNSAAYETLMRFIVSLSRDQQEYAVKKLAVDHISEDLVSAWKTTFSEINKIKDLADTKNIPVLLLIAPYQFQLADEKNLRQPQDILLHHAIKQDIQAVDLLPYFSSIKNLDRKISLFNDSNHFSENGHAITSMVLANTISGKPGAEKNTKR